MHGRLAKNNAEVQMLVEANSKPHGIAIYTDGSVTRDRSCWGFTVKQGGRTAHEDSGANKAMHSLRIQSLQWIYCPGHAGVSGNERPDRLASTADMTYGLQLGRAEVLRGLRNFLNMDRPEHHNTDRLKERRVDKGSGRHSIRQGRERSVFKETNIGTVSKATLGDC